MASNARTRHNLSTTYTCLEGRGMSTPHQISGENPEQHIGPEIPDPWLDPEQTDWPIMEVNTNGMDRGTESE